MKRRPRGLWVSKAPSPAPLQGKGQVAPPGSESVACNQSSSVNVGDPDRSSRMGVSTGKCNSQGVETGVGTSEGA
jgi:hypothetical protein